MNQDFVFADLETIDYYFVACAECGKATDHRWDWPDAIADAKAQGYQIDEGTIYCKECADLELQRQEEEINA